MQRPRLLLLLLDAGLQALLCTMGLRLRPASVSDCDATLGNEILLWRPLLPLPAMLLAERHSLRTAGNRSASTLVTVTATLHGIETGETLSLALHDALRADFFRVALRTLEPLRFVLGFFASAFSVETSAITGISASICARSLTRSRTAPTPTPRRESSTAICSLGVRRARSITRT